jgi:cytochrome P450
MDPRSSAIAPANPFHPDFRPNPHPLYHYLRSVDPVHRSSLGVWILTRHADCLAVLKDPAGVWSHDLRNIEGFATLPAVEATDSPVYRLMKGMMLFNDPPLHTRLRGLFGTAFHRGAIDKMRPTVEAIARHLVEAIREKGRFDLIADFAFPLPLMVIVKMLGIPVQDAAAIRRLIDELTPLLEPDLNFEVLERATWAEFGFIQYLIELIEERRTHPGDDLVSALLEADYEGRRFTTWELMMNLILLLIAGQETAVGLVGNGILALLRSPEQLELLRNDASMMAAAIEEFIRFEPPVHLTGRIATQDVKMGEVPIAAGEEVVVLIAAANRDPAVYPEPDQLDITRTDHSHLGFGHGVHFCLGAPLARLEAPIALSALLSLKNLRLAGEPVWRPSVSIHGLTSLELEFDVD